MKKIFDVDGRYVVGDGQKIFVVAEVGINHNGDMELAKDSIIAAAEAGADAVKFQSYRTEDFILDKKLTFSYQSQGKTVTESQYDMFKRCELTRDQLYLLKETCDSCGVNFHSTPTSIEGVQDLQAVGCSILKNGSDYLTHLELIRQMGETGLLTVLSTGMATLSEIDQAVQAYCETGNESLILLHCTSAYPTPAVEVNLLRLETLRSAFDVPVGFSDHSEGVVAGIGATLTGACWLEKHFTVDRTLSGPDHWFSMSPNELQCLVKSVREADEMNGSSVIAPTSIEHGSRQNFRLSCVASRDLGVGEKLRKKDIVYCRPGNGLPPNRKGELLGKKTVKFIKAGEVIVHESLI